MIGTKMGNELHNPLNMLIGDIYPQPQDVSVDTLQAMHSGNITDEEKSLIKRMGISFKELSDSFYQSSVINFERVGMFREIDRAITHPIVGSASELYADVASCFSKLQDATIWPTGESAYVSEIINLFDRIGIEEKIFDWLWNIGTFGDLFVRINAKPGVGIISVEDDTHPIDMSRLDHNGILVGFYDTPLGQSLSSHDGGGQLLHSPWEWVHFRLLGAKRKRSMQQQAGSQEYRATYMMSQDTRRVSTRYGTSLLVNALPVYKRLRMCEDSLMMARITRGPERYIYKVKVDGTNISAVSEIVDSYKVLLKRARAIDTTGESTGQDGGFYNSTFDTLSAVEDILLPVWGDVGDLSIDKIGGNPDIKWIADIEEFRNQLASALRVPLSLLGGYVNEASGALGSTAIEKLDIRFARSCRRLQRALLEGMYRMCQIHFAYLNMDTDLNMYTLNMPETSTAEEEELKDSLDTGVDIVGKFMEMLENMDVSVNKPKVFDYLNSKILKLNDFSLGEYLKAGSTNESVSPNNKASTKVLRKCINTDILSATIKEQKEWESRYKDCKIQYNKE